MESLDTIDMTPRPWTPTTALLDAVAHGALGSHTLHYLEDHRYQDEATGLPLDHAEAYELYPRHGACVIRHHAVNDHIAFELPVVTQTGPLDRTLCLCGKATEQWERRTRANAARSLAATTPTRMPQCQVQAGSLESSAPWVALCISRRTYYRRKKAGGTG